MSIHWTAHKLSPQTFYKVCELYKGPKKSLPVWKTVGGGGAGAGRDEKKTKRIILIVLLQSPVNKMIYLP